MRVKRMGGRVAASPFVSQDAFSILIVGAEAGQRGGFFRTCFKSRGARQSGLDVFPLFATHRLRGGLMKAAAARLGYRSVYQQG